MVMDRRIFGLALVLCLLLAGLVLPAGSRAAPYSGNVRTTDDTGVTKTLYFTTAVPEDRIYFKVTFYDNGVPTSQDLLVVVEDEDGNWMDSRNIRTNRPVAGQYESWSVGTFFRPAIIGTGDFTMSVWLWGGALGWLELYSTTFTVGPFVELRPAEFPYVPGDDTTIVVVVNTPDRVNVTIRNETGALVTAWNNQSLTGYRLDLAWTVPLNLPDGLYTIQVNSSVDSSLWVETFFDVQLYDIFAAPDRQAYLPGESMMVVALAWNLRTAAPVGVTWEWRMDYEDTALGPQRTTGSATGLASFEIVIPDTADILTDPVVMLWANDTDGRSLSDGFSVNLGITDLFRLRTDQSFYNPGDVVRVTAEVRVAGDPLPGAQVDLKVYWAGSTDVLYSVSGLMTDATGTAQWVFPLGATASAGTYTVTANVSKLSSRDTGTVNFVVSDLSGSIQLTLAPDKAVYYSGDTVNVTYELRVNGSVVSSTIDYLVGDGSLILAAGSATGGSFSFAIPANYAGTLDIEAMAASAGGDFGYAFESLTVLVGDLEVAAATEEYTAGQAIPVQYNIAGNWGAGTSVIWTFEDSMGNPIASGTATGVSGSFSITPPADATGTLRLSVWATDPTGRSLSETVWLTPYSDLQLRISITTQSEVAAGSFKPGDVITIHYEFVAIGDATTPSIVSLSYGLLGVGAEASAVGGAEGDLSYTIPEEASDATYLLLVSGGGEDAVTTLLIDHDPPIGTTEVAGIAAGDLLIAAIAIAGLALGLVALWKMRHPPSPPLPRSMEKKEEPPASPPSS